MSERSYRIRTDVNNDKVVRFKTEQDYDFLEILSLKIKQEDTYKLHTANYGVIVGRVLANDSFGIPNAKVSVFIELDDEDKLNSEITNIYPYTSFQTVDSKGRRYNLLPDESTDECYQVVGTFPNKRLVLDNDTYLEVFDKYWKYTTVTNKSGDYMIFGVPTGGHQIHVDIDLSDIGILSQKPIDFMYKGYNETQFENAQQFKTSNNLDNLTQLLSQNQSVHVYPFWGDTNLEEIAISRCDIQVQYKFEPTCIFFGAIMTDNYNNNIGHKCSASKYAGFNRHLVTGEGIIEMIRKTPDNLVEEFQIQGNKLIDGDGVWCYQIPMNLDFVGTDEFGNIVPTDDPKKGIPTRTCVRFRVSMQETGNEGVSRHRAKYLIPNVQELVGNDTSVLIESGKKFEQCYEFGSATPDEYYRDLYWNKVYSVKNYIPRLQTNTKESTQNYSALRSTNLNNDVNPAPFNHARFRLAFAYRVLCMIMTIVFAIICALNALVSGIAGLKILWVRPFGWVCSLVKCIGVSGGLTEDEDSNIEYFPCCTYDKCAKCGKKGCTKESSYDALINVVQQSLSQEYDTVNLDFYNDWLNGSLYMPLWFWKKTKKKKYFFGLFSKKAVNSFCSCSKNFPKLRITQNCSLPYDKTFNDKGEKFHDLYPENKTFTIFGVIKEFVNKAGLNIYYYAPGIPNTPNYKELDENVSYIRLYSTDIILLGSINSCDLDNYPSVFTNLPTTTVNVPFIATIKQALEAEDGATYMEGTEQEQGLIEVTGMDWLHKPEKHKPKYGAGLFMDLACNAVYTKPKSCINLERMCELGVTMDTHMEVPVAKNGTLTYNTIMADGMITRYELVDNETRAMFASLNNNGLQEKIYNPNTGYYTYKLRYVYPIDFDGRMYQAETYTSMMDFKTYDIEDATYMEYRFGPKYNGTNLVKHFYSKQSNGNVFPVFNNSFYFYFGIHEGSTAIDKFNSRFYATCYKDNKYPFNLSIESEPAKWCPKDDKDYGTININLNGIKTPFSYKLFNEFNEEILNESGLYEEKLYFGYEIDTEGNAYKYDSDGNLIKNGYFTNFTTNVKTEYKVENGTYKLEITDVNGNVGIQNIILDQVPINLIYGTVGLGDKYYDDIISKENDFCNQNQFFGEITISGVTIDGKDYRITNNTKVTGGNGEYMLKNLEYYDYDNDCNKITSSYSSESVKITIVPQSNESESESLTFRECTCHGVGGFGEIMYKPETYSGSCPSDVFKVIYFPIWKPNTFKITVNQYCNGELNDNISDIMAVVKNGEPFNAYINGMPLKFILGKNEQFNAYNPDFYKVGATLPTQLPGWFKLHKEDTYYFSATTTQYESIWSDFTNVNEGNNTVDESDTKKYLTEESLFNIVEFKLQKMFSLSKGAYVTNDGDAKLNISHTGGKPTVLYRGNYPVYSEIVGDETPKNKGGDEFNLYIANSDGSVTCNNAYPNIVGNNYTYVNPTSGISTTMFESSDIGPFFNRIYNDFKNLGNYFAAFTRNGSIEDDGDGNCKLNDKIKYQQIPYKSSPMITSDGYDLECLDAESESDKMASICYKGDSKYKSYFRGEFVDRRLDYNFVILTPYAGDDVVLISDADKTEDEEPEPIWKKGRISGTVINGIEMVYDNDKDYNIIGPKLEYFYNVYPNTDTDAKSSVSIYNPKPDILNPGKYINGINIVDKRFYKTILKCSNKKYDINDMYWAYDPKGDISYKSLNTTLRSPKDFGYDLVTIGDEPKIKKIFSYDHSADTNMFNGDFSMTNYPIRRLLDVGNVPSCDKITFTCSSCSYDIDAGISDGAEEMTLTGTTQETDETEFVIDCRNMINPELTDIEEAAANGNGGNSYNVLFKKNGGEYVSTDFKLRCRIKQDAYNTTHDVYTEFPSLFVVKRKNKQDNIISIIKNDSKNLSDIISNLTSGDKGARAQFGYDNSTVKDISKTSSTVKRGPFTFHIGGNYWVTNADKNIIAYDDNVNVKNVVYTISKNISDIDVLGVYLKRNFLNNNGDNLNKNITTIQFTSIYDIRKFEFKMCCAEESESIDSDVESKLDIEVDGGLSFDIVDSTGDTAHVDTSVTSSGNTQNTPENTTATTKTQRTIFKITTYIDDTNYNQGFFEVEDDGTYTVDSLSAVLVVRTGKKEYKTTDNVKISCDPPSGTELNIYIDCFWSGELSGYYLNRDKKPRDGEAYLYISLPNKLMYMLKLNLNELKGTNDCCPATET